MPYNAKAIANLFIDIARDDGKELDQMKLQKLVYLAHGWNLAINDNPLIDTHIEAWQYGPVIRTLYEEFRNCGRAPIMDYATDTQINEDNLDFVFIPAVIDEDDRNTRALCNKIWEIYGDLSGPQLSNLTHQEDTPWHQTFRPAYKAVIDNNLIKQHFISLAEGNNEEA